MTNAVTILLNVQVGMIPIQGQVGAILAKVAFLSNMTLKVLPREIRLVREICTRKEDVRLLLSPSGKMVYLENKSC